MEIGIVAIVGLVFGSFAGAQVWRLRAHQLAGDKAAGEQLTKQEYTELTRLQPLRERTVHEDRSRCLHCKHALAAYDLVPLLSWFSTAGRCRYCKAPIGYFEPLIEIGTAAVFVISYLLWPFSGMVGGVLLALWLVSVVLFTILFAYDSKWFLLPDRIVVPLMCLGAVFAGLQVVTAPNLQAAVLSLVGALVLLPGLYAALYYYSLWRSQGESTWVGFGDVKLGIVLALFLSDWRLAFLTIFLANFLGSLVAIPAMLLGKLSRGAHIPFGPLLIAGFYISFFWGEDLIVWFLYSSNTLMLY